MLVDYGNRWKASKGIYSKMLSSLLRYQRINLSLSLSLSLFFSPSFFPHLQDMMMVVVVSALTAMRVYSVWVEAEVPSLNFCAPE